MAIIKPSLKFEGSELNLNSSASPYLKDGLRRAIFSKTTNQDGAYLYFLSAYKADPTGAGVWYKKIFIRDNFGTNYKEKYYVRDHTKDPAYHFGNNFRLLFPEEARVKEEEVNGKKFKKYPNFGRNAERVIYNVAFASNLQLGAHVLDLPLRNGADILMNWLDAKDMLGNVRQPINDPERSIPVLVKMKDASANPWSLQVENTPPVALPAQLADTDYLYNLDEILIVKPNEEILAKLREMYAGAVFDACMDGFPGLLKSAVAPQFIPQIQQAAPQTHAVDLSAMQPAFVPAPAPVMEIARPTIASVPAIEIPKAAITAPTLPVNPPTAIDLASLPPNPMAGGGKLSREEALKFISQ